MNFLNRLLGLPEQQASGTKTKTKSGSEPLEKNFMVLEAFLQLPINGRILEGLPKYAIQDSLSGRIRWGSSPEWAWAIPGKPRIVWRDDAAKPLSKRKIKTPTDPVGFRGTVGSAPFVIEKVLEIGENQVVYCFYSERDNMRIAYGFDRLALDSSRH